MMPKGRKIKAIYIGTGGKPIKFVPEKENIFKRLWKKLTDKIYDWLGVPDLDLENAEWGYHDELH